MLFIRLFIISSLLFNIITDFPKDRTIFVSPVNIPILLSANFGELRIDHFHSGIDIKTQGVTGKEVVAADAGYIYRISVSPGGFGKALYIRHPSGFSTVYAHLDRFTPEIDDYVINQQYDRKSYLVTLFPSKDKFPVKQGDLIAFSGNSGSSGGPHLHFEIRKSDNEIPINPLFFDLGIEDDIKPVIEKLVIYPVNSNSFINNRQQIKKVSVSGSQGRYFIPAEDEIIIKGAAGFGIKSFDLLNDSYNKCAAYTTELFIDSTLRFKYVMDGFSFNESRFINSHIDYENYMREKVYIERMFILPNDKLSVYKDVINRGVFNFNDNKVHYIEILISDIHNNKSSLTFKVKSQSNNPVNFKKTAVENHKLIVQ